MKRIVTFLLVLFLIQSMVLRAQTQITTIVTPKVQLFPTTGLSYLEDPFKYFNVTMTNTSAEPIQIYVDLSVSCDFTASGKIFRVNTPNTKAPVVPITIGANQTRTFNYQDFKNLLSHLNSSDIVWQGISWQDALMLPEGNYQICVTPYVWEHGGGVAAPRQAGVPGCCNFTLCYTGSAPEFTAPIVGQSASNNNIVNPRTDQNGYESEVGAVGQTSDNRATSNYNTLNPTNKVVFSWTGVISNCITNSNLNYMFKLVEVMPQQTVLEAINNNPAIYSINAGSRTTCIIDTLKDLQVRLKRGCTYAAQVTAVAKDQSISLKLGNNGKSQVIAFNWGKSSISTRTLKNNTSKTDSTTNDNKSQIIQSIYNPYLFSPVVDDDAADILVNHFPSESGQRPINTKTRVDDLYYQFNDKEDLEIAWMPLRGDSVTHVEYSLNLYEYIGDNVSYSTTRPPLKTYKIEKGIGSFDPGNSEFIYMPEKWKDTLKSGVKYYLVLEAASHYKYLRTTTYTTTTTANGIPSTSTSTRNTVMSGTEFFYSNIIFQWGIDSSLMETVQLAQLTYPVDMAERNSEYKKGDLTINEVYNDSALKFKWKKAENVASYDEVKYNLLIAKLGKGKIPTQVKDTFLYYKDITDNEYMCDEIRDSLKVGQQYIAYVETKVKKTKEEDPDYIVPNKGYSYRAAFKIVETEEITANLDPKVNCYIDEYNAINKKDTLRPKDINEIKKMELKMNKFKVVFEEIQLKTDTLKDKKDKKKKILRPSYYGKGYIVWHPFGVDTRIKVQLDSILFNSDHEIFTGCATTIAADEKSLLPMDFSGKIGDWSEQKVNKLYSAIGDNEDCKEYIDAINEKKGSYVTVGGMVGMGDKKESPSFFLPLSVKGTDFFIPDDGANMMLNVNNMRFTPSTALMNLFALYYSHEDNLYIPLLATNICVAPEDFLAGADGTIDMYLAKSIDCELKDGYKMRLKAASKLGKKDDGTVLSFGKKEGHKRGGFQQLNLEFEFDLAADGLLGINAKSGVPQKDIPVKVSALAVIQEWGNWMARVKMDAFALEDFPEMSFVPGKGIWYDHSSKSNPTKFPKDYKPTGAKPGANATWQGFFMEDLGVVLSDKISTAFGKAEDDLNRKAMYSYSYGVNGELKDSSEVAYSKGCLGFHVANMLIDGEGFTADFQVHDILNAATDKMGGWAFSIDTIGVKVEKNKFKKGYINGGLGVPLLTGNMKYNCAIATDELTFGLNTNGKDTLGLDLWAAKLEVTKSQFKLVHKYDATMEKEAEEAKKKAEESGNTAQADNTPTAKPQTSIDLKLNGVINIDFDKIGLPISFAGVKFENFTLRNFQDKTDTNAKQLGDSDLWFYMGKWSKASPQHYMASNTQNSIFEGSIGNVFTYSVETLKPVFAVESGNKVKIGFATACKVGFKTGGNNGEAFSIDATCGFKVWGKVNYKTWDFDAKDIGGALDSIRIQTNSFSVFKLNGAVAFIGQEDKDPTYGEGLFGTLEVTIMDKITISMAAGFGNKDNYKWWFLEGAASGLNFQITPVTFTGFGGGFAYNMTVKEDAMLKNAKAHELISSNKSFGDKMVTGSLKSCSYIPQEDSWVAKAGISLALENEKVMNADGILTLRVSERKFSGIVIDATAYVMSNVTGDDPTKSAEAKNSSPLLVARALLGYEQTDEMHYFRLSLCVKGQLDLANFIKDKKGANNKLTELNEEFNCMGENIKKDVSTKFEPLKVNDGPKNEIGKEQAPAESSAATKTLKDDNELKLALTAQVPIDLEVKAYKKGHKPATCHSATGVDWYFSVGKPTSKKERVMFDLSANLIVCNANAEFTFYFITGNNFDYQLPELDPEVKSFFYGEEKGKQTKSSDVDKVNSQGNKLVADFGGPKFEKAGGFAMGATFKASVHFDFFLYVDVFAALGFDVALMDTRGQSCEGYDEIGKNNFYATGQLYAMLKGSAGLSINLGFWKGKLELCSLGIGALLKGGGPRPSWAYGLLRLKASVLNGLLSVNTSVDFHVGDVCVPGAGDPLANVHFFENVSPGQAALKDALSANNLVEPIGGGAIVSNMPWDEDVILCSEEEDAVGKAYARRFRFVIERNLCEYYYSTDDGKQWYKDNTAIKINSYSQDNTTKIFSHRNGGFQEQATQKWKFVARAFEWRLPITTNNKTTAEKYYDVDKCITMGVGTVGQMNWYDPEYEENGANQTQYRQDTTIYFKTKSLPPTLNNQVVYTWPYNGDPSVPVKEFDKIRIYTATNRADLFDPETLEKNGNEIQCWLIKGYGGEKGIQQVSAPIKYVTGNTNYVEITPPCTFDKGTPYLLRFILVNKDNYQAAIDVVLQKQQVTTLSTFELTSQNWDQVYASHQASKSTSTSGTGRHNSSSSSLNIDNINIDKSKINHQKIESFEREVKIHNAIDKGETRGATGRLTDLLDNKGVTVGVRGGSSTTLLDKTTEVKPTLSGAKVTGSSIGSRITPTNNNNLISGSGSSIILSDNNINTGALNNAANLKGTSNLNKPNVRLRSTQPTGTSDKNQLAMNDVEMNSQMANASLTANAASKRTLFKSTVSGTSDDNENSGTGVRRIATIKKEAPVTLATKSSSTIRRTKVTATTTPTKTIATASEKKTALTELKRQTSSSTSLLKPKISTDVSLIHVSSSSSGSSGSSTNSSTGPILDIADEQYEKLKEDYTEQGIDTSMLYERTSLEKYTIACEMGDTIYDFCFKTDPKYDNYNDLFNYIMSGFSSGKLTSSSQKLEGNKVTYPLSNTTLTQPFSWYSYLFTQHQPNDATRYNTNITLPAIATFILNTDYYNNQRSYLAQNTNWSQTIAKHYYLMSEFARMMTISNKYTKPAEFYYQASDPSPIAKQTTVSITCGYGVEYFNGTLGGIIKDAQNQWKNTQYRSRWIAQELTGNKPDLVVPGDNGNTFNTNFKSYWYIPDILTISSDRWNELPIITLKSFGADNSKFEDKASQRTATSKVSIIDYATPAMKEDVTMFLSFFQTCLDHASYICSKESSFNKRYVMLQNLYKSEKANAIFQFENDFPYLITKSLLLTHYFLTANTVAKLMFNGTLSKNGRYYFGNNIETTVNYNNLFSTQTNYSLNFFWFHTWDVDGHYKGNTGYWVESYVYPYGNWYASAGNNSNENLNALYSSTNNLSFKIHYLSAGTDSDTYFNAIADRLNEGLSISNNSREIFMFNKKTNSTWTIEYNKSTTPDEKTFADKTVGLKSVYSWDAQEWDEN